MNPEDSPTRQKAAKHLDAYERAYWFVTLLSIAFIGAAVVFVTVVVSGN